jgi:hypothetical protein
MNSEACDQATRIGFFKAWRAQEKVGGQRGEKEEQQKEPCRPRRQGWRPFFRRPHPVIPCQVASQQSLTPFHQATQV